MIQLPVYPPTSGNSAAALVRKPASVVLGLTDVSSNQIPVPYTIAKSAVAVGVPSSGSFGNNGALNLTTALGQTYSEGIYLYFPASAIVSGSAAGLYYTIMSSTTVGTVYNNVYTSGDPVFISSPTAFATTGSGAYTQAVSITITLRSIAVPANSMGANGVLRYTKQLSSNSTANSKSCADTFGGFSLGSVSLASTTGAEICRTLHNRGTGLQVYTNITASSSFTTGTTQRITSDTTTTLTFASTVLLAFATDFTVLESFMLEVLPA